MVTLRICEQPEIGGVVDLQVSGTLDGIYAQDKGSVELSATRQVSYTEWYSNFLDAKVYAMRKGKPVYTDDNGQDVEQLFGKPAGDTITDTAEIYRSGHYLKTIQGVEPDPDTGDLVISGGKNLDISVGGEGKLEICLPTHHYYANRIIQELDLMTMRMYHCYNSFAGRLQAWGPEIPVDGRADITTMGHYLGTYLNYQALVCRWNAYAWANSFTLEVVEAGERVTLSVGFVNLNCTVFREVCYSLTITPKDDDGVTMDTALTIFDQGVDSTIDPDIPVTTTFHRNGKLISGTGYEGRNPDVLTVAAVHTVINSPSKDIISTSKPVMPIRAEQYYRNIIAIAPCSGVDTAYDVQPRKEDSDLTTKKLTLTFTIALPDDSETDTVVVTREKDCEIVVVSYDKEEEVEEAQ